MRDTLRYDIGGLYELVMKRGARGYYGHYTNLKTGVTITFTANGMTKKQILTKFWDRAKELTSTVGA